MAKNNNNPKKKSAGEEDEQQAIIVKKSASPLQLILNSVAYLALAQLLIRACQEAYSIRMHAIHEYGRVIHEFDPYFNYRATEYLYEHGWKAFSQWYDYMVWYPLGRPVGTTIYPGMQVTSVLIKKYLLPDWSINDVCVFVPTWFGVTATLSVAWLTFECVASHPQVCLLENIPLVNQYIYRLILKPVCTTSLNILQRLTGSDWGLTTTTTTRANTTLTASACAVAAACIMAIVPAHLLRSVGGGYDNESVAMTAMVLTFATWVKSLQSFDIIWKNAIWGCIAGLAYFNMVAAWGGYVFVLNVIGVHAGVLVLLGRYSTKLWLAYTCFYVVGTALAIRVPVVGWTPLKSLEQMGPLVGFLGLQLIQFCQYWIAKRRLNTPLQIWKLRLQVFLSAGAAAALIIFCLAPTGYFGPISSRVRGLFVKHTKTGNPLVDSVAEHQAASPQAYFQYLHNVMYIAPIGLIWTACFHVSDSSSFLLVYGAAAYYFSHRMVRLILLTAPIASVLAGIVLGRCAVWAFLSLGVVPMNLMELLSVDGFFSSWAGNGNGNGSGLAGDDTTDNDDTTTTQEAAEEETTTTEESKTKKSKTNKKAAKKQQQVKVNNNNNNTTRVQNTDPLIVKLIRLAVSYYAITQLFLPHARDFWDLAHEMMQQISHPSIIQQGRTKDGTFVRIDDYREAYWWLRDHTPLDARIMAWWDYGYQITGIGNRTTIADGNTWNHEHIAFLGRTLTSPEKEAHRVARHLADYVLVWAGGGGDDLAKSPHLRRIANSVFRGLCSEPTCRDFGFHSSSRRPTKSMEKSLLYKLVMNKMDATITVDANRFKEVYRSKYGKVRIYKILSVSQESKEWVADPKNRQCDAPGSWVCRGQYPPALTKILAEKKDFRQLEDFNKKNDAEDDSEYQRQYLENLMKAQHGGVVPPPQEQAAKRQQAAAAAKKKKERRITYNDDDDNDDDDMFDDDDYQQEEIQKLTKQDIELINQNWENDERTTILWQLISQGDIETLKDLFLQAPSAPHIRSQDGRGPMWWAYEYQQSEIIQLLKELGVSDRRKDENGKTPRELVK